MSSGTEVSTAASVDCLRRAEPEPGLSVPHKCTFPLGGGLSDGEGPALHDELEPLAGVVTVWQGGSIVEVTPVPELVSGRHTGGRVGGGVRGRVGGFSADSRRRMLKMLSRLRADAMPLFLTLTLPDTAVHDGRAMKKYLRRFKERVRRRFPGSAFVWRLECVPRKSGDKAGQVVGHYHLLWYGVAPAPGLRDWVSIAWFKSVATGDLEHLRAGTRVEVARSGRQVRAYASKLYSAKASATEAVIDDVGRFWGQFQGELLPWADAVMHPLTVREYYRFLRVIRGYVSAGLRHRGKRRRRVVGWRWCLIGESGEWVRLLESDALGA